MKPRAHALDFALQSNLAGALVIALLSRRPADCQRHRRLLQVIENGGEKGIQELFVDRHRGLGCGRIANSATARGCRLLRRNIGGENKNNDNDK